MEYEIEKELFSSLNFRAIGVLEQLSCFAPSEELIEQVESVLMRIDKENNVITVQ